ncbi:hypothetical protein GYMLUDRAFT_39387 [Collybiopsis luxurians FD-317 M1]|nr:hypothetical protein GYMLUDRAFT_39387 [Collybiopsis luxurians FD-317 M1]
MGRAGRKAGLGLGLGLDPGGSGGLVPRFIRGDHRWSSIQCDLEGQAKESENIGELGGWGLLEVLEAPRLTSGRNEGGSGLGGLLHEFSWSWRRWRT